MSDRRMRMKFEWEYENELNELQKEYDLLKKALSDACEIIVENGVERGFCMLPKQGYCRDCPLGDSDCDVASNWFNYFLENARHSPE